MRSAVLALLVLAGCEREFPSAKETVAAAPAPSSPVPPPGPMQALGVEPFWSFDILPGQLRYSTPENLEGTAFTVRAEALDKGWRFTGTLEGKALALTITSGTCSDGMSDTVYPFKASFTWGERTEQGCAWEK
jgi:uncharacterized membrane protein